MATARQGSIAVTMFDAGAKIVDPGAFDYVPRQPDAVQASTLVSFNETHVPQSVFLDIPVELPVDDA